MGQSILKITYVGNVGQVIVYEVLPFLSSLISWSILVDLVDEFATADSKYLEKR